jgi:hypothetical protein
MKALLASDLSVDSIIERVMIRNGQQPYDYANNNKQLTPQEHIWHFHLQEENVELKRKVKELGGRLKKREEDVTRKSNLERQVEELQVELKAVLQQNQQLQRGIDRIRLRNSQINESIRMSLDESVRRRKGREC